MGGVTSGHSLEDPPLARLFAMAFRSLIEKLHERLRVMGWTDVRPAFGFVLVAARDRPTTCTELAALMEPSGLHQMRGSSGVRISV